MHAISFEILTKIILHPSVQARGRFRYTSEPKITCTEYSTVSVTEQYL